MESDRERVRRCGPLSACARNGHADRLPGESLEDHVWLPGDSGTREAVSREIGPAFEYASEEVGEAFTEWCASEGIEARDDQEYRTIRAAFTAGMNEVSRYGSD